MVVKTSVLLLYIRVFGAVKQHKITGCIVIILNFVQFVAVNLLVIFTCTPVTGHCLDSGKEFLAATISNIMIDVIILAMPMPMLWQLEMSSKQKIGLVGVFAAGYW